MKDKEETLKQKERRAKRLLEIEMTVQNKGYAMLEEHTDFSKSLKLLCPNEHVRICSYQSFKKSGCKQCNNEEKLAIIINSVIDKGYMIIEFPKDARSKMIAECSKGHIREANIHNFLNHKCSHCVGNNVSKDIEFCKDLFSKQGFDLLEDSYVNCKTPMKYKCSCGEIRYNTLDNVLHKKSVSCKLCKASKMTGENHPNWNHNLTEEDRDISRNYPEYSSWRLKVYERDVYTCQCCWLVGNRLTAHHIYNYSNHKDLRTLVSNGITLCFQCHSEFHSEYTRFNNDIFQLQEYFDDIRTHLDLPLITIESIINKTSNT